MSTEAVFSSPNTGKDDFKGFTLNLLEPTRYFLTLLNKVKKSSISEDFFIWYLIQSNPLVFKGNVCYCGLLVLFYF
jgi:hypothetical protein